MRRLLAAALVVGGCSPVLHVERRERIVSVTPSPRAPTLLGAPVAAGRIRLGGAAEWTFVPQEPEAGDPARVGGRLVPAGMAEGWFAVGLGGGWELGVSAGASFPGTRRTDQALLPFAPPESRLAQIGVQFRFLGAVSQKTHVGFGLGFRVHQVRLRWDIEECVGGGAACTHTPFKGGPFDEQTFIVGGLLTLEAASRVTRHLSIVFAGGFELVPEMDTYEFGEITCYDNDLCLGALPKGPPTDEAAGIVFSPLAAIGLEVRPAPWLRARATIEPIVWRLDRPVAYLNGRLAAELVF